MSGQLSTHSKLRNTFHFQYKKKQWKNQCFGISIITCCFSVEIRQRTRGFKKKWINKHLLGPAKIQILKYFRNKTVGNIFHSVQSVIWIALKENKVIVYRIKKTNSSSLHHRRAEARKWSNVVKSSIENSYELAWKWQNHKTAMKTRKSLDQNETSGAPGHSYLAPINLHSAIVTPGHIGRPPVITRIMEFSPIKLNWIANYLICYCDWFDGGDRHFPIKLNHS